MLRMRACLLLLVIACGPEKQTTPPEDGGDAPRPTDPGDEGSPFDRALAEMVAACTPVGGSPRVHERRIDLDRDGHDEAIFNVSCADVSQWKLLGERDGEAVVLLERIATQTDFDVLLGPDGRALLVIQHDCCCRYELEVHTLEAGALKQLFAWSSGCGPGCDAGYKATVESDPGGTLRKIELPRGACGADGRDRVDLRSWAIGPATE